jgi:hypothetical protein
MKPASKCTSRASGEYALFDGKNVLRLSDQELPGKSPTSLLIETLRGDSGKGRREENKRSRCPPVTRSAAIPIGWMGAEPAVWIRGGWRAILSGRQILPAAAETSRARHSDSVARSEPLRSEPARPFGKLLAAAAETAGSSTLEEVDQNYILQVFRETGRRQHGRPSSRSAGLP